MKAAHRCIAVALLVLSALDSRADDGAPCGKNHYILDAPADCWEATGSLNVARMGHTATLLPDGRVLAVGGTEDVARSAEIYDPASRAWTLVAPLHHARTHHSATVLRDGRVLVVGGAYAFAPQGPQAFLIDDTAEIYDPAADTWTLIDGPLTPRIETSATLLPDGRVLVAGGVDVWDEALSTCELYDPATNRWEPADSFGNGWGHTATALADGRVLVVGGFDDDWELLPIGYASLYDPQTGRWSSAGELKEARALHAATLLADGRVLVTGGIWHDQGVAGGYYRTGTLASSEIYDPVTNRWSSGADIGDARSAHTATLLADGSMLLAGGMRYIRQIPALGAVVLDDSVIATTASGPWAAGASLNEARFGHTATLLGDGSVLVAGGSADPRNNAPLASAELYRAAPGSAR